MSDIKKHSEEVLGKNPWWEYKRGRFILPNGENIDYYFGETNGNVIVVPVLDDGRLVLVRQYRYVGEKNSVEFPGGGIKPGESPSQAAVREFLEETGYKTENMIKIGAFEPCVGLLKDLSHIFIANELVKTQPPKFEATENTEVLYRRVDEFEDMIKRGEIWDGQMLAVWALARELVLKNTA